MTTTHLPIHQTPYNDQALQELAWAIEAADRKSVV